MDDRNRNVNREYVRGQTIADMLDISVRTLYRRVAAGDLPGPVRIGRGTSRWRLGDVIAHIERRQSR
jgi:predicted DNA-binding transcriptional regulator AlpA